MPTVAESVKYHAERISDTSSNGGRRGTKKIIDNSEQALFPYPTRGEMVDGIADKIRFMFMKNENASNVSMFNVMGFQEMPSNGDDKYLYADADWRETNADVVEADTAWCGCGKLNSALTGSGSEVQVELLMESNEPSFINGNELHIADYFFTSQTIGSGVTVGDSVELSGGTWGKIALDESIIYLKGRYMGDNIVMSYQSGTNTEAFVTIAENLYEDEDIGDGDGSDTSPTLSALANATNGIVGNIPDMRPVVTVTVSGSPQTVTIGADGTCTGYCSAGQLNMADGTWTTPITFTAAPDNATNITITYREKPYSYSGNVATVDLDDPIPNAYGTSNTYAACCLQKDNTTPAIESWVETSTSGTFDESGNPVQLDCLGTFDDDITITFTSATAFTVSGLNAGNMGSGTTSADFTYVDPETGADALVIPSAGWGGTWATNETINFTMRPAEFHVKVKQDLPSAATAVSENQFDLTWMWT